MKTSKLEEIILFFLCRAGLYPWSRERNHIVEFLQVIAMDHSGDIDIELPTAEEKLLLMSNAALESLQDKNLVMIDDMEYIIPFRDYKDEDYKEETFLSDNEVKALEYLLENLIRYHRSIAFCKSK